MATSIFLARLMGPVLLVIGVALLTNAVVYRRLAQEFLDSPALIFLSGLVTMPAGLAIVLTHNVWAADWRVLITILGWLALFGGAMRLVAPQRAASVGRTIFASRHTMHISTAIYLGSGAVLSYFGYRH